jgi:saccharopepsin
MVKIPVSKRYVNESAVEADTLRLSADHGVPLKNRGNTIYYATIGLGTPAQSFYVQLDTGSSNFWVPGADCAVCDSAWVTHHKFVSNASSTYQPVKTRSGSPTPVHLRYGTGRADGYLSTDTLTLGDLAVNKMHVAVVTSTQMPFPGAIFDGILGLGFDALAYPQGVTVPFLYRLKEHGVDGVFTFEMTSNGAEGIFVVGGVQTQLYNSFGVSWLPLMTSQKSGEYGFWMVAYGGTEIAGRSFGGGKAIVDSGTSCILLPPEQYAYFESRTTGKTNCDGVGWPDISVQLGGRQYIITGLDYIISAGSGLCKACVQAGDGDGSLLLGDVFHRKFVVTYDFDNKRIGVPIFTWWDAYWAAIIFPPSFAAFFLTLRAVFYCTHKRRRPPLAREPFVASAPS